MHRRLFAAISLCIMAFGVSANPIKISDAQDLGPHEAINVALTVDDAGELVLVVSAHRRDIAGRPATGPVAVEMFTRDGGRVECTPQSDRPHGVSGVGGTSWVWAFMVKSTDASSLTRVSFDYAGKGLSFNLRQYTP